MKIAIITKFDNNNYGNRLQNYALQQFLNKKTKAEIVTLRNYGNINNSKNRIVNFLKRIKHIYISNIKKKSLRKRLFLKFNEFINTSLRIYDNYHLPKEKGFDYFVIGSDQVWNPNFDVPKMYFGDFTPIEKNISFAASFGISKLPIEQEERYKKGLENFKMISVRENPGKEIAEKLTGRTDVEVLVDPTMLLTAEEWNKVSKKPEQLKSDKKYILNYFLGKLSEERKAEIERISKENDCDIINILDRNDPFYETGPSEFLYLEKNAFLICTDSFHSSVFAILYNRPFIVFEREQVGTGNMNSRIDTLLTKFKLKDRTFNGKITKENLEHDYSEAYKILEIEREKSKKFLEKALDVESEKNEH